MDRNNKENLQMAANGNPKNVMSPNVYDQLVVQVDSLKIENTTLKKELQNNTSQICRLETEADNLKVSDC